MDEEAQVVKDDAIGKEPEETLVFPSVSNNDGLEPEETLVFSFGPNNEDDPSGTSSSTQSEDVAIETHERLVSFEGFSDNPTDASSSTLLHMIHDIKNEILKLRDEMKNIGQETRAEIQIKQQGIAYESRGVNASGSNYSIQTAVSCKLLKCDPKEDTRFLETRKELIFELCIFAFFLLVGFGATLGQVSAEEWAPVFKDILFASGVISLLDSVYLLGLAKALRALVIYRRFDFSGVNIAGFSIAILFIAISGILEAAVPERDNEDCSDSSDVPVWSGTNTGIKFVEAGFIYFATRVYYLTVTQPNPHEEVLLLEKENDELKQSVSIGLAEGYIYNFLEPHIKKLKEEKKKLFVLIPQANEERNWISKEDYDIKSLIQEMIVEGIIQERAERYKEERVDSLVDCKSDIDIPTTLTVLTKGIWSKVEEGQGFNFKRYNREIDGFGKRIQQWVEDNNHSDFIKIIEFEISGVVYEANGVKYRLKIDFKDFVDCENDGNPNYISLVPKRTIAIDSEEDELSYDESNV